MGTVITEADGGRKFLLETGAAVGLSGSVFMTEVGGLGVCFEFTAESLRSAIRRELGMVEPVIAGLERMLAA